jgi:putative phosphoribosyl transferase
MSLKFHDRAEAGRRLAERLLESGYLDPVILGLPRGGVPVAAEVAARLDAPLDVVVVRKIGAPGNREYALGAIGEGDVEVLDEPAMRRLGLRREHLAATISAERDELERRVQRYRAGRPAVAVAGRTAIVVDDGIATGNTAVAAARVLRALGAAHLVMAAPVGPPDCYAVLEPVYDEVVVLSTPRGFMAVGTWYDDFGQTPDQTVVDLLAAQPRR